jgi:hypothetical protein
MSDLSITAANVVQLSGNPTTGVAGVAMTAGQSVYQNPGSNNYLLAKSNSGTTAAQSATGIALNSAAAGQPVTVMTSGTYTVGATVTVGGVYVLSGATAGGIAPIADLTSGWFTQIVLVGLTATTAKLTLVSAGVAVP